MLRPALVDAGIAVKIGETAKGKPIYDFQGVAFHAFRKACGSLLLHHGKTLKQVQGWLRHSQLTTTLNTYIDQVDDGLGGGEVWEQAMPDLEGIRGRQHPQPAEDPTRSADRWSAVTLRVVCATYHRSTSVATDTTTRSVASASASASAAAVERRLDRRSRQTTACESSRPVPSRGGEVTCGERAGSLEVLPAQVREVPWQRCGQGLGRACAHDLQMSAGCDTQTRDLLS